jgi:hypothetical protein
MPVPSPGASETREAFVSRFMASEEAKGEWPDEDQRLAVAFSKWREMKKQKRQRIKQAQITHISLCPRGKTGLPTIFKADGQFELHAPMAKMNEAGELLAVVYAPSLPDADGHMADAEVIKGFAHEFLRDHRNVDVQHDLKVLPKEKAYVAESFTVAKGDSRFADFKDDTGRPVDVTGGWAVVVKIEDEALRGAYRSGGWSGISMYGKAVLEPEVEFDVVEAVKSIFDRLMRATKQTEDIDMTKEELQAALAESQKAIMVEVAKAIEPLKPKADEKPKAGDSIKMPAFTGDLTKRADVTRYQGELRLWSAQEALRAAQEAKDSKAVEVVLTELAKLAEADVPDADAGIETADTAEVRDLKRRLFKAQRASRQPEGDDDESELLKEHREKKSAGKRIADMVNKRRGHPVAAK